MGRGWVLQSERCKDVFVVESMIDIHMDEIKFMNNRQQFDDKFIVHPRTLFFVRKFDLSLQMIIIKHKKEFL